MRKIDEKTELKSMEKNIYANVLMMMTIFIALFTLININVDLVKDSSGMGTMAKMICFNLGTVGSIALLISFAQSMFSDGKIHCLLAGIGMACFVAAMFVSKCL